MVFITVKYILYSNGFNIFQIQYIPDVGPVVHEVPIGAGSGDLTSPAAGTIPPSQASGGMLDLQQLESTANNVSGTSRGPSPAAGKYVPPQQMSESAPLMDGYQKRGMPTQQVSE